MKYAVLLLALMFVWVATPSMAQKLTFEFEGETIEVAKKDFPKPMNWDDAKKACENLGNGWRLPSIEELKAMYEQLHKQGKGNFQNTWYWSSSQDNSGDAFFVNFYFGYDCSLYNRFDDYHARAVRTLP